MRPVIIVLALSASFALALTAQASPQYPHEHQPAHAATSAVPIPAQRWTPDAPLQDGMRRVRQALTALQDQPGGHNSHAVTAARARDIKNAGAYMFAHCKLAAQPDEALHSILMPLLAAAQKLEDDPSDLTQVQVMQRVVAKYPLYFDDSGWAAVPGPAHTAD